MKTGKVRIVQMLLLIGMTGMIALLVYGNLEKKNLAVMLLLLFYFLWNIWTMHQLMKSRAVAVEELERSNLLISCVTELSGCEDVDRALNNLLKLVTEYFHGDRTYIFNVDYEQKLIHNSYEYAKTGVTKEIENLKNIPISVIQTWLDMFEERGMFYIFNLDAEKNEDNVRIYEILKAQNISSLIAVPLKKNGEITGFLGVDNPRCHCRDFELLTSIQAFIVNRIETRAQQEKLKYLSYRDLLTNLYNRNRYMRLLDKYRGKHLENIGVVYIDLNGLKQVNDEQGHEAGDSFIRRAAQQIVAIFPDCTYRVGGDEFVVVYPNVLEQQFAFLIDQLKLNTRQHHVSISFGAVWKESCVNLDALLKEADEQMYQSKKKFYENEEHDRRRKRREFVEEDA